MISPKLCRDEMPKPPAGSVYTPRLLVYAPYGATWFVAKLRTYANADGRPMHWLCESGAQLGLVDVEAWMPLPPTPFLDGEKEPTFSMVENEAPEADRDRN